MRSAAASAAILLATTCSASAALNVSVNPVQISQAAIAADSRLANMHCLSITVSYTDGYWGSAAVYIRLPAGSTFYQAESILGPNNFKPSPALVGLAPQLEFDTYISSPRNHSGTNPPSIVGTFPPGVGTVSFGGANDPMPGVISVSWGEFEPALGPGPGTYEIVRMTMPHGVFPNWNVYDNYTAQVNPTASHFQPHLGGPVVWPVNSWLPDADGDWNDLNNWSGGTLPQVRQRVLLDVGGPEMRTITHTQGDTTLHELRSFERIALVGGTLTTHVTEINGALWIGSGTTFRPITFHHLTGTGVVEVASDGTIMVPNGSALVLGSGIELRGTGGSIINDGSGGMLRSNGARIVADGGGLVINLPTITGRGTWEVAQGSRIAVTGQFSVDGTVAKAGGGPLRINGALAVPAGSHTLNLVAGSVINDYTGPSPLSAIRSRIISGYNDGDWDGTGINSSTAAADSSLAVGYAEASALFTSFPATFAGEAIDNTTLLIRLVRSGDANLDGTVNLDDFNRLAASFGSTNALWSDGDFTYDGVVNLADFNRLAANFGLSAAPDGPTPDDWAALASSVPEPGAAGLALLAKPLLIRRRRKS